MIIINYDNKTGTLRGYVCTIIIKWNYYLKIEYIIFGLIILYSDFDQQSDYNRCIMYNSNTNKNPELS